MQSVFAKIYKAKTCYPTFLSGLSAGRKSEDRLRASVSWSPEEAGVGLSGGRGLLETLRLCVMDGKVVSSSSGPCSTPGLFPFESQNPELISSF